MTAEFWPLSLIYKIGRDIWSFFSGRKRARIERGIRSREKWKEPIREHLLNIWSKGLREDIIIRDFQRLSQYPDTKDEKGISAWFRIALLDLYHNGVIVGLRVSRLVFEDSENAWRKAGPDEKDGATLAFLVGYIPFESIASVDFDGDEYYSFPHLVCHFEHRGQPYERLAYCKQNSLDGRRYFYTDLEKYEVVNLTSAKFGTNKEW